MIYIIDHQDSFTWNVVHQFAKFDKVICTNYYEVNYKLTDDTNYIEHHLDKYPDTPVITSPETAEKMNNPLVAGGEYKTNEVIKLSNENFEKLLNTKHSFYLQEGAASAGMIVLSIHLFPFFVHYFRGNIDKEQFLKLQFEKGTVQDYFNSMIAKIGENLILNDLLINSLFELNLHLVLMLVTYLM